MNENSGVTPAEQVQSVEPSPAPVPVATPAAPAKARELTIKIPDLKPAGRALMRLGKALMPKNMAPQSKVAIFGMALPAYLIWLAFFIAFALAPFLSSLYGSTGIDSAPLIIRLLTAGAFAGGILYYVLAAVIIGFAVFWYRRAFRKHGLDDLRFGDLRVASLVHGVAAFMIMIFATHLLLSALQLSPEGLGLATMLTSIFSSLFQGF